jgi:hypothetical protein
MYSVVFLEPQEYSIMWHQLPRGDTFWSFLLSVDRDLAETARQSGCECGGRLHHADYPRRPRGCPDELPEAYRKRLSFCCDRDGCRKRVTPPSVRFLGRKVYLSAIVILIAAMRHSATPNRVRELSRLIGADRRTIDRWQAFWREHFPQTVFWKVARGRIVSVIEALTLPRSLMDAFLRTDSLENGWGNLLRFLSPITINGALLIKGST